MNTDITSNKHGGNAESVSAFETIAHTLANRQNDDVTPELQAEARQTIIDRLGPQAIGRDGKPTLDALKQALSGNYKPITSPAPEPAPALARKTARKRATQKAEPKAESKPEKTTPAGSKVSSKVDFQTIAGRWRKSHQSARHLRSRTARDHAKRGTDAPHGLQSVSDRQRGDERRES